MKHLYCKQVPKVYLEPCKNWSHNLFKYNQINKAFSYILYRLKYSTVFHGGDPRIIMLHALQKMRLYWLPKETSYVSQGALVLWVTQLSIARTRTRLKIGWLVPGHTSILFIQLIYLLALKQGSYYECFVFYLCL